jgi:hypothetical protein
MKYAMLIYQPDGAMTGVDESQRAAITAEYFAIGDDPACVEGAQLQPVEMATTVRVSGGEALTTDGPFADTKEVFAGYYVFELPDLDAALEVAARIPAARLGGSVEVRGLVERQ